MTIEKWAGLVRKIRESGIPVYDFPEDAVRSLSQMARYDEFRRRQPEAPPAFDVDREAAAAIVGRHEGRDGFIPQADAFALLAAYGIGVASTVAVASRDDLDRAGIGFPAVLKVDSAAVVHKSEQGGVILGIRDAAALRDAYDTLQSRFGGPGVTCVLQEQRSAGREVIIGQAACPGLGAIVMFGLGGVFVEVLRDVAFGVAPLTRRDAREMMREIRGSRVLSGVRGEPAIDADAIETMLCRVARLAADFPAIVEMDLNPVFAYPAGQEPVAVDARIRVR
jgi:acetyltransferase